MIPVVVCDKDLFDFCVHMKLVVGTMFTTAMSTRENEIVSTRLSQNQAGEAKPNRAMGVISTQTTSILTARTFYPPPSTV